MHVPTLSSLTLCYRAMIVRNVYIENSEACEIGIKKCLLFSRLYSTQFVILQRNL